MGIQKNKFFAGVLGALIGLLFVAIFNSCVQRQKGNEINQAADLIKEHAIKSNPALKGKRLKVNMSIDGGISSNDPCACIVVCDGNGENCTSCVCSPANCGSCR
jgi:hypothetical protein